MDILLQSSFLLFHFYHACHVGIVTVLQQGDSLTSKLAHIGGSSISHMVWGARAGMQEIFCRRHRV